MIIDDNLDVSMIIALNLRDRGYTVLEAQDGETGCQIALTRMPCLILCDEKMPVLDGQGALLRLKNVVETASIPVLMIGGTGLSSEATWKIRGAAGFVPKPFRMNQLLAAVEQILTNPKADLSQCDD